MPATTNDSAPQLRQSSSKLVKLSISTAVRQVAPMISHWARRLRDLARAEPWDEIAPVLRGPGRAITLTVTSLRVAGAPPLREASPA